MVERYPPEINHEGWPRLVRKLAEERRLRGRRHRLRHLHAGAQAVHRAGHGRPRPADGEDPHDHGEVGLHRLGLHPDGARRRARAEEDRSRATSSCSIGSGVGYNQAAVAMRVRDAARRPPRRARAADAGKTALVRRRDRRTPTPTRPRRAAPTAPARVPRPADLRPRKGDRFGLLADNSVEFLDCSSPPAKAGVDRRAADHAADRARARTHRRRQRHARR